MSHYVYFISANHNILSVTFKHEKPLAVISTEDLSSVPPPHQNRVNQPDGHRGIETMINFN